MVSKANKRFTILLILTLSFLLATPVWADEDWDVRLQKDIESHLFCQDDCGMIVSGCDNATAQYMREIIIEKLQEGYTKQEVLDHFVGIYGEQVLTAPPAKGFNLVAWVTPFVFVIGGGLTIYLVVDKWVFNKELDQKMDDEEIKKPKLDLSEYEDKLDDELKKYL